MKTKAEKDSQTEFLRNAIVPSYRHEYLGMLMDLTKKGEKRFRGGYRFLRNIGRVRIDMTRSNPWLTIRPNSKIPCDDPAAYALEGIRFGIDFANKPSVTVKAKVKVDPKRKGLNWLWFEELSDFEREKEKVHGH